MPAFIQHVAEQAWRRAPNPHSGRALDICPIVQRRLNSAVHVRLNAAEVDNSPLSPSLRLVNLVKGSKPLASRLPRFDDPDCTPLGRRTSQGAQNCYLNTSRPAQYVSAIAGGAGVLAISSPDGLHDSEKMYKRWGNPQWSLFRCVAVSSVVVLPFQSTSTCCLPLQHFCSRCQAQSCDTGRCR